MPLRVLHVIGGDDTGGAMSYLLPLLTAMREEGCECRLLCLGDGGLARAAALRNLLHTVLPMNHPWDARVLPGLRRELVREQWQVVHTHGMRANLPVRLVLPSAASRPLLFTSVHSDLTLDYASRAKAQGYEALDRLTWRRVDAFCCVSQDLAGRLEASGVPRSRVHVVHPGIELPAPTPAKMPAPGLEPPGGAATQAAIVGTVARLVKVKDLSLLLEGLAMLEERVPGARALVVGDGPERSRLERESVAKGLAGRVEFLGQVHPAWPALARLGVFVVTSESEGLPISVLEAMAMSLPVVATAVGGLPEAVDDGLTGFLVGRGRDRTGTAAALASRMAELLLDAQLRERMGEAGRKRVEQLFSSQVAGRKMLSVYGRELAGSKSCRRAE